MSRKISIYIILIFFIVSLTAVIFFNFRRPTQLRTDPKKILVSTSFYPLYFLTQEIGGDKVVVINITPAGAEPHDYEPTARDIAQIESSSMLVINGNTLEAWANSIKNNIDPSRTKMIIAGEGLANQTTIDNRNGVDPHIWLDPNLAQKMVDKITFGFMEIDPVNSNYYQSNATVLKSKLAELDKVYRQGLSRCENKNIITAHAAFAYLTRAYGLNQIAITGLSPEAEASPRQLADLSQFARNNKINYIFFESLVSPKLAQTLADEIGAQTLVLNPLEGLSDADLKVGKNYFSEMENNLINLKIALKCQ